jgi:ABC-type amino acid transport substrate-binding protein
MNKHCEMIEQEIGKKKIGKRYVNRAVGMVIWRRKISGILKSSWNNNNFKRLYFSVVLCLFSSLSGTEGRTDTAPTPIPEPKASTENIHIYLDNPDQIREIKVAAASDWSPYSGRDKDGDGVGPAYELIKKIVEPMGIGVVIENDKPWRRYVQDIQEGTLDIILAAYKVEPFGEYSEYYSIDQVKVFVKPGNEFSFNSIEDLSTKIGVQPKGAGYDVTFRQRTPGTQYAMRENSDAKKCIEMVLDGYADYYVSAYYDVLKKLKVSGYEGRLIDLKNPVYVEEVVMVVSRESAIINLMPEINKKIEEFRRDGTVDKLIENYMKEK